EAMTRSTAPAAPVALPMPLTAGATEPSRAMTVLAWCGILMVLASFFYPARAFADDRYWLGLFTRYIALALFALSVDLIWGSTGLLSLVQGLYFGIGAYAAGYSPKLQAAATLAGKPFIASPDMARPNFMEYCGVNQVPFWIRPLIDIYLALVLAVVLP